MSKQSEAKKEQGYVHKAVPPVCVNCKHFKFEQVFQKHAFGQYTRDTNLRCGIGGFAVRKMGSCLRFKRHDTLEDLINATLAPLTKTKKT